jgi:ABC-type branched-subunit amino acid transport system permease subunit
MSRDASGSAGDVAGRLRAVVTATDRRMVAVTMAGIYALFLLAGLYLGRNLAGMFSLVQQVTFFTAVYALVVLALNLHWGYAGLFNIGVIGYMAVGVYTMAMLSAPVSGSPPGLGLPAPVGILGGMLAAAFIGLLTALPALRLRADYLAIVTVAISEIIRLTFNSPAFSTFSLGGVTLGTGGASGIGDFPINPVRALYYRNPGEAASEPTAFGDAVFTFFENSLSIYRPALALDLTYALVLVVLVALVYTLLARVGNSPFGRVLKAIREDEMAAKSLGKDTNMFKIKTFMLGCALMGVAGIAWFGYGIGAVYPQSFRPRVTFYVFIALIIGGAGSNTGSVLGGAIFANVLFLFPPILSNIVTQTFAIGASPNNVVEAVGPVAAGNLAPLVGYILGQIPQLRFVLVGVILIYLIQNRPEGVLGHRGEEASTVDLSERRATADAAGSPAADGGSGGETDE